MRAYFDDIRDKPDTFDVVWRSTAEAIAFVENNGCPSFISFDFDLGGSDRAIDFVKWLVERDNEENGNVIPVDFGFVVHSANPVGASYLEAYLNNYLKWKNNGKQT